MAPKKTRVLCVDDSEDIARILDASVAAEEDMESVGWIKQVGDLLGEVVRTSADVVVLDLTMPGGKDPLELVRELREAQPGVRVVVFSGYEGAEPVESAKEAGAWGYVSKHDEIPSVLEAIRRVARGEAVFPW